MLTPRWPVRAVGSAHFAPPTQRTRRDGLVHGPVRAASRRAGGDDYAFVPPAAPSSRTDRFAFSKLSVAIIPVRLRSWYRHASVVSPLRLRRSQ